MPKRIALIIATNNYADQHLARLSPLQTDPAGLSALLRDSTVGNFNQVEVILNEPAGEIRRRIDQLFRQKKRHDLLLLYWAGHTLLDQAGRLYLAAADTRCDLISQTAIPAAYVTECMDHCFSRQQILMIDGCHTALAGPDIAPGISVGTAPAFKGSGYGRTVMVASDTLQYILNGRQVVGEEVEGSFGRYLIQGLRTGEADLDDDGQIDVNELHQYVYTQLMQRSANGSRPRRWSYYEPDKFIIARNQTKIAKERVIKWDLIFGAIMAPTTTIAIGGQADLRTSVGLAGLFLLLYAILYWLLD